MLASTSGLRIITCMNATQALEKIHADGNKKRLLVPFLGGYGLKRRINGGELDGTAHIDALHLTVARALMRKGVVVSRISDVPETWTPRNLA
jgi:hypothetical protein